MHNFIHNIITFLVPGVPGFPYTRLSLCTYLCVAYLALFAKCVYLMIVHEAFSMHSGNNHTTPVCDMYICTYIRTLITKLSVDVVLGYCQVRPICCPLVLFTFCLGLSPSIHLPTSLSPPPSPHLPLPTPFSPSPFPVTPPSPSTSYSWFKYSNLRCTWTQH